MPFGDRKLTMEELGRVPADGYSPVGDVRLVLDNVRSRHNVGSIFRTADSFGVNGLELCGITPCPPHREIEKTALGATLSVPWRHHGHTADVVRMLKEQGYMVLAVEQTLMARSISEMDPPTGPVALVFGNELEGVSEEVITLSDIALVVPQHGSKHSLNVSVCVGVLLWWLVHP